MTKLQDALLCDIVPDIFSDTVKLRAYSLATRTVRRMICDYAERMMIYKNLERLPDAILDLCAAEMKTLYYSSDLPREIKVKLIRDTIYYRIKAGTTEAVQEMAQTVFGDAKVVAWHEYGGAPYYFRISTTDNVSEETLALYKSVISKVKNTVSTLEHIEIVNSLEFDVQMAGGVTVEEIINISCEEVEDGEI